MAEFEDGLIMTGFFFQWKPTHFANPNTALNYEDVVYGESNAIAALSDIDNARSLSLLSDYLRVAQSGGIEGVFDVQLKLIEAISKSTDTKCVNPIANFLGSVRKVSQDGRDFMSTRGESIEAAGMVLAKHQPEIAIEKLAPLLQYLDVYDEVKYAGEGYDDPEAYFGYWAAKVLSTIDSPKALDTLWDHVDWKPTEDYYYDHPEFPIATLLGSLRPNSIEQVGDLLSTDNTESTLKMLLIINEMKDSASVKRLVELGVSSLSTYVDETSNVMEFLSLIKPHARLFDIPPISHSIAKRAHEIVKLMKDPPDEDDEDAENDYRIFYNGLEAFLSLDLVIDVPDIVSHLNNLFPKIGRWNYSRLMKSVRNGPLKQTDEIWDQYLRTTIEDIGSEDKIVWFAYSIETMNTDERKDKVRDALRKRSSVLASELILESTYPREEVVSEFSDIFESEDIQEELRTGLIERARNTLSTYSRHGFRISKEFPICVNLISSKNPL